ncbi:ATP-dependent Clp protease adapter ClpS [Suttonella sp. R2A3]|uniref:ATP-dependent Clp protease adapter ClpS n=1 Tax=Suttonella sp. R2A3 TaxID=2908648 RepID=UPI001F3DA643|nr:ATP-dependent Clp protease adapter ClpS [Suttonella sp. R2A3]UJF24948.1 ATP-dependent Clp protease adapter ClpS [Suttonella sp. R2A3]
MSEQPNFAQEVDAEISDPQLEEPQLYEVMLLNDDYTTMDFVIDVLMQFFRKSYSEAELLMFTIHEQGSAVCAIYSREIAEMRVKQVVDHARAHEYPLLCVMQPH